MNLEEREFAKRCVGCRLLGLESLSSIGCNVPALVAEGYTFLWIGSESSVLKNGFAQAIKER